MQKLPKALYHIKLILVMKKQLLAGLQQNLKTFLKVKNEISSNQYQLTMNWQKPLKNAITLALHLSISQEFNEQK